MKKRILGLILAMVTCIVLCLGLVGCNKCSHSSKTLIEDTATCENNGIATYKCNDCGETIKEDSSALGHDYEIVSNTATCVNNGVVTHKCKLCNEIKTENVSALGHSYNTKGQCIKCSKFKYDIELAVILPKEFSYINIRTNHIYSKFILTDLNFKIVYSTIYICFSGKKTYDEAGQYGNERIYCTAVLKDKATGAIIGSDALYATNLIVNQTFSNDSHSICKVSDLDLNKEYILEIVDREI